MSKIEEALKKAKQSRGDNVSPIRTVDGSSGMKSNLRELALAISNKGVRSGIEDRRSSAKEIALMDDDLVYDSKELSELKVIYSDMADNKVANTYRDLRTKLLNHSQGRNFVVMVTSCMFGQVSSSVTLNLSAAFSFDQSKTSLLIDCDLNNPKLDKLLGLDTNIGLTDYLENEEVSIDSILHKTGIKRLRMIPAGSSRETVAEYFTSQRMKEMMIDLISRYSDRFIFVDSAPIPESADTRILVELCDFVILVVPYGRVTKNKIKEAADAIGSDKLIGVVFADVPKVPKFNFSWFD
ncbi:MAG: CpsD/CapB family tyrosine-protein kinase [Gammaproteobacteria bacterium]|nr:CpsD/CapB family tyrosine-protein kinase [Gammaproteobacteria bacterium]